MKKKNSDLKAVYLPQTSKRILPLKLPRGKVSDSTCRGSLDLINWDYDLLQKLNPATCTKEHRETWWQDITLFTRFWSKAFWSCFPNFIKNIWEFTWEKGTTLTARENAEAKAKNPLVTALRNDSLVVLKVESLFLQKWDEESLTPWHLLLVWQAVQPVSYLHAFFSCSQNGYFPVHKDFR